MGRMGIWRLLLALSLLPACHGDRDASAPPTPVGPEATLGAGLACAQDTARSGANPLQTGHILHSATLLADGSVLVGGGFSRSTERFRPGTEQWAAAGTLRYARRYHSATFMADGRVLFAGGRDGKEDTSTEAYDSDTDSWSTTGTLKAARRSHSATLLGDDSILVAGGTLGASAPSAERYTPATDTWAPTGAMLTARRSHTATLLADGRVLVVGGEDAQGNRLAAVEVYSPTTGTWSAVASLSRPRSRHTATALPDGRVLVVGGAQKGAPAATAEVYSPATGTWVSVASMASPRRDHTATLLTDGSVLVVGGYDEARGVLATVERYQPATGTWCQTTSLGVARYGHVALRLEDGRVLVAAGYSNADQSSVELLGTAGERSCDALPPRVTLTAPPEGFLTREPRLSLAGSVDDSSASVTVNGVALSRTGRTFSGQVPLSEGSNPLRLVAEDRCHNQALRERTVLRDSTPPTLSFLQPGPGTLLHEPSVAVLLAYADESSGLSPTGFQLLLDGADVSGVLTHSTSGAQGTVALSSGAHTLVARVADRAGNVTRAEVALVVELPRVTVELTSPDEGSSAPAPASVRLAALARSFGGATVARVDFLKDGAVVGSADTAPHAVTLSELPLGTYVFQARAVDGRGGEVLSAPRTFTVYPLGLRITAPVPGALVSEGVLVRGTLRAPEGSRVQVNGLAALLSGDTFQVRVPVALEGPTPLDATLTTPDGRTATQSVTVMASPDPSPVEVRLSTTSGFAPLRVTFTYTNRTSTPLWVRLKGMPFIELRGGASSSSEFSYPAGIHVEEFTVEDNTGSSVPQSFVIEVIDREALDQKLRAMWSSMNEALVAGDKARALAHLSGRAREKYGPVFDTLLADMPGILASCSPPQSASLSPVLGTYAINRTLEGVDRLFFIHFVRDEGGDWHLESM